MIRVKQINNQVVKAIPKLGGEDTRPVLGAELFPRAFCNIFLSAKKFSGKTSAVFKILQSCVGKNTRIIAFCSTLYNDDNWIYIKKYFENKGNDFEGHTSLKEDGVDLLDELVKDLEDEGQAKLEAEEEEQNEQQQRASGFQKAFEKLNVQNQQPRKPKRPKYLAPDIVIVLDDLSNELKSKSLVTLLKKHRHFKTRTIISSQYYLDLLPESRQQIDYYLLFKGQTDKKLETIYRDADLSVPYSAFVKLYEDATKKPYGFLWVDARTDKFRSGFNKEYELPAE